MKIIISEYAIYVVKMSEIGQKCEIMQKSEIGQKRRRTVHYPPLTLEKVPTPVQRGNISLSFIFSEPDVYLIPTQYRPNLFGPTVPGPLTKEQYRKVLEEQVASAKKIAMEKLDWCNVDFPQRQKYYNELLKQIEDPGYMKCATDRSGKFHFVLGGTHHSSGSISWIKAKIEKQIAADKARFDQNMSEIDDDMAYFERLDDELIALDRS